jgi:hypothetical protein
MEHEKDSWLKNWRIRSGLRAEEVDRALGWAVGTTEHIESMAPKVPLQMVARAVELYGISAREMMFVIREAQRRLQGPR